MPLMSNKHLLVSQYEAVRQAWARKDWHEFWTNFSKLLKDVELFLRDNSSGQIEKLINALAVCGRIIVSNYLASGQFDLAEKFAREQLMTVAQLAGLKNRLEVAAVAAECLMYNGHVAEGVGYLLGTLESTDWPVWDKCLLFIMASICNVIKRRGIGLVSGQSKRVVSELNRLLAEKLRCGASAPFGRLLCLHNCRVVVVLVSFVLRSGYQWLADANRLFDAFNQSKCFCIGPCSCTSARPAHLQPFAFYSRSTFLASEAVLLKVLAFWEHGLASLDRLIEAASSCKSARWLGFGQWYATCKMGASMFGLLGKADGQRRCLLVCRALATASAPGLPAGSLLGLCSSELGQLLYRLVCVCCHLDDVATAEQLVDEAAAALDAHWPARPQTGRSGEEKRLEPLLNIVSVGPDDLAVFVAAMRCRIAVKASDMGRAVEAVLAVRRALCDHGSVLEKPDRPAFFFWSAHYYDLLGQVMVLPMATGGAGQPDWSTLRLLPNDTDGLSVEPATVSVVFVASRALVRCKAICDTNDNLDWMLTSAADLLDISVRSVRLLLHCGDLYHASSFSRFALMATRCLRLHDRSVSLLKLYAQVNSVSSPSDGQLLAKGVRKLSQYQHRDDTATPNGRSSHGDLANSPVLIDLSDYFPVNREAVGSGKSANGHVNNKDTEVERHETPQTAAPAARLDEPRNGQPCAADQLHFELDLPTISDSNAHPSLWAHCPSPFSYPSSCRNQARRIFQEKTPTKRARDLPKKQKQASPPKRTRRCLNFNDGRHQSSKASGLGGSTELDDPTRCVQSWLRQVPLELIFWLDEALFVARRHTTQQLLLSDIRVMRRWEEKTLHIADSCKRQQMVSFARKRLARLTDIFDLYGFGPVFSADGSLIERRFSYLKQLIEILPSDWAVCQIALMDKTDRLDKTDDGRARRQTRSQQRRADAQTATSDNGTGSTLMLTVIRRGLAPRAVVVPFPAEAMLEKMGQLIGKNAESIKVSTDRRSWWEARWNVDKMCSQLLWDWQEALGETVVELLSNPFGKTAGQTSVSDGPDASGVPCLFLSLDARLQGFPWEWMACLRNQSDLSVNRIIDLRSLVVQIVMHYVKGETVTGSVDDKPAAAVTGAAAGRCSVDWRRTFYILNPANDLQSTEDRLRPAFELESSRVPSTGEEEAVWWGMVGRQPERSQVVKSISRDDVLLFCGHGSGSRAIMGSAVSCEVTDCFEKMLTQLKMATAWWPVGLLFGCSSAAFSTAGSAEPFASVQNHLARGMGAVLGFLWDITDRDADKYTTSFLQHWCAHADRFAITLANADSRQRSSAGAQKSSAGDQQDDEAVRGNDRPRGLTMSQALRRSRLDLKLRWANGVPAVVYGLPFVARDWGDRHPANFETPLQLPFQRRNLPSAPRR